MRESFEFLHLPGRCIFFPLVTGAIYEFNSKTGARRWKDPLTQLPKRKESSRLGAAWSGATSGKETGPLRGTNKEGDGLSGQAQAEEAGLGSRDQDGKLSTPKNRNPAPMSRAFPKPHPEK